MTYDEKNKLIVIPLSLFILSFLIGLLSLGIFFLLRQVDTEKNFVSDNLVIYVRTSIAFYSILGFGSIICGKWCRIIIFSGFNDENSMDRK